MMRKFYPFVSVFFLLLSYSIIASGGGTISGSVLDGDSLPTPGGFVRIYDSSGEDLGEVSVDDNGDFETGELDDGDYFAITMHTYNTIDDIWDGVDGSPCVNKLCTVPDDGTEISIISGANVTGIDFVLDPITSGGVISGHVEDSIGTPLAGVTIRIHNRDGHHLWDHTTDESGNYVTELWADETYYVFTENEPLGFGRELYNDHLCLPAYDCNDPAYIVANGTQIVIPGTDPDPGSVNFVLAVPEGNIISGKITDAGPYLVTGVPLPDIMIHLLDASGVDQAHTWTDNDGDYYFSGLPNGDYRVYTSGVPEGYVGEFYPNAICSNWDCDHGATGDIITVPGTGSSNNDIALAFTGTRIFGTVTRSDNLDPVSAEFGWFSVDLYESNGDHAHRVHTNSAGQYQFVLYAEDDYYLVTNHDDNYHNLFNEGWDDAKCFDDCNPPFAGATLTSVELGITKVRDFELDPAYYISGVIRDETDNPISDGYVNIWDDTGTQIATHGNDGDGNYGAKVAAGTYYATVRGEDWGRVSQIWQDIPCPQEYCDITGIGTAIVFPRDEGLSIDFNLLPQDLAWTISGSILNGVGDPVGGGIRLFDPYGNQVDQFWTDESGNFQTSPLADGTYFAATSHTDGMVDEAWQDFDCANQVCDVTATTAIVINGGDESGIDFVLTEIPGGGHISGIVTGLGSPLANTGVTILNRNGEYLMDLNTGPDGRYQTPLLANDNYYVHTIWEPFGLGAELYEDHPCLPSHVCRDSVFVKANGTEVDIFDGDHENVDFNLVVPPDLGMIAGQVTDADLGMPLPDVNVSLLNEFGHHMNDTNTDKLGNYYFSGLEDGNYKIAAVNVPEGYSGELFDNISCDNWSCNMETQGTLIEITSANTVDNRNFALSFTGTRILGTVTRSDSLDPVTHNYERMAVILNDAEGNYIHQAGTNSAGQYEFHFEGPGNYLLYTDNDQQFHGLINEVWDDVKCSPDCDLLHIDADLISVANGTTVVADFILDPSPTISGKVIAQIGATPLENIVVCAVRRSDAHYVGCGSTNSSGDYIIKGLFPEDNLVVIIADTNGQPYLEETYDNIPIDDWGNGNIVNISVSSAFDIDFALDPGFFITGTVRDAVTTLALEGAEICIHRTDSSFPGICENSNASGFYQAGALPAGSDYVAYVRPENLGYKRQVWEGFPCPSNDCDVMSGTPIILGPGDAPGIDFNVVHDTGITGTIRSSATDDVLRNGTGQARLYTADGTRTYLGRAFTDENGLYRFSGLEPGSYFVELAPRDINLVVELYDNIQCPRLTCDTDLGEAITLVEGQIRMGIDATLDPGSLITGHIYLNGNPLANAHVSIYNEAGFYITRGWSDESGYYKSRSGFPAGNYYAANRRNWEGFSPGNEDYIPMAYENEPCGYPCDVSLGELIPVDGNTDVHDIDFNFVEETPASISGSILDNSGQPTPRGAVQIFNSSGDWQQDFWVDENGHFETYPLSAGTYFAATAHSDNFIEDRWDNSGGEQCPNHLCDIYGGWPIVISEGINVTSIDFKLDPITSGGFISGRVEDSDHNPLANLRIIIFNRNGEYFHEIRTDLNGDYQSRLLVYETYYVRTEDEPLGLGRELFDDHLCLPPYRCEEPAYITAYGTPIVISDTGTDPDPVDFVLDVPLTGHTLSGQVIDAETGIPLAGIGLQLTDEFGYQVADTPTDRYGNYYFSGLPDGNYKVVVPGPPEGYVITIYPDAECPNWSCDYNTTGTIIPISGSHSPDRDIALVFTGTRFFGTVTRSDTHDPVSSHSGDMHVGLFNAEGHHLGDAYTDSAGHYQFAFIDQGDYFLVTNSDHQFHGLIDEGWDNKQYFYSFDPIDIGADLIFINNGETLVRDFDLDLAPTISGTVIAEIGTTPLEDIDVCVTRRDGYWLGCTSTDSNGDYTVKGLSPETDLVVFVADTNGQPYLQETWDNKPYDDWDAGDGVDISSEDATGIDFALATGYFITGTVRVAATTDPVEGTDICIHRSDGSFTGICGHTDASGFYQAGALPAGTDYTAYVIPDNQSLGYKRQMWLGLDCPNNQCDFSLATPITLGPGDGDAENINFNLTPDTGISGVIRSSVTGEVLSNNAGRARLYSTDGIELFAQVYTDENGTNTGSYYFGGLEPGDYLVLAGPGWPYSNLIDELWNGPGVPGVHCPRLSCDENSLPAAVIPVTEGNIVTGIDVELDPGSQITGNLTIDGAPAGPGYIISFYTSSGDYAGYTSTEDGGSFESAAGFPEGDYFAANRYMIDGQEVGGGRNLGFFPTTYLASNPDGTDCGSPCVIETSGGTLIGLNGDENVGLNTYNWVTQPPATISGSILDRNGNSVGGLVHILDSQGQDQTAVWTDQYGGFETEELPAGIYFAVTAFTQNTIDAAWDGVDGSPCINLLCDVTASTPIVIYGGINVTGINFVLDPISSGGTISGHLQDIGGLPLINAAVAIFNRNGMHLTDANTDQNGDFESDIFGDETYYVRTNREPFGLGRELYNNVACLPSYICDNHTFIKGNGDPIIITGSDIQGIDFVLEVPAGNMISGKITDEGMLVPLAGYPVALIDNKGNDIAYTTTDQLGDYYFSGLPNGDYKVITDQGPEGYILEFYPDAPCPDWSCDFATTGTVITVTDTDSADNDIALAYVGTRIFGTVTRVGGDPVSSHLGGMAVQLFDAGGGFLYDSSTNNAGQYQFNQYEHGLSPGDYYLTTESDNQYHGLLDEAWNNVPCFDNCNPFDVGANLISVSDGDTLVRDFELDPAPVISGTVSAETGGALLEGIEVCVARQLDQQRLACKLTDASGYYELIGLQPRDDLVVWIQSQNGQSFFREMYLDQSCCDISQGTPVDVTLTDQVVDFQLASSASLTGRVVDSATLEPIGGISLYLFDTQCNIVEVAMSDSSGYYSIAGFNESDGTGVYYLFAEDGNQYYISTLYPHLNRYDPCFPDIRDGWAIAVGDLEQLSHAVITMDLGGSISGTISNAAGVLPGYQGRARLYDLSGIMIGHAYQFPETGSYRLGGLMPGSYHLILTSHNAGLIDERYDDVKCPRNSCPEYLGTPIVVGPEEQVTDKNAELDPGAVVRGRVTDIATSEGVPGGYVLYFYTTGGKYAAFASTDEDGYYETAAALPDGEYLASNQWHDSHGVYNPVEGGFLPQVWTIDGVSGACGEPCDLLLGDTFTVAGLDPVEGINLIMQHGSTVSGNVEAQGGVPLQDIELHLLNSLDGSVIRSVVTDGSGDYVFEGVYEGTYYLRTFNTLGYEDLLWDDTVENVSCNPFCSPFDGAIVVASDSPPDPIIDFTLKTTPSIEGTVTDHSALERVGVRVEAYNTLGVSVAFAITNSAGYYILENLWAGSFYVRTLNNLGFVDALHNGQYCETGETGCDPTDGTAIPLVAGVTEINLQLGEPARIEGRVADSSDDAIPGVTMELYRDTGDFVVSTTTDGSGEYELEGLEGGDYHLVTRNDFGYIDEGIGDIVCQTTCPPTSTAVVTLAAYTTYTYKEGTPDTLVMDELKFELGLGGAIAGMVYDSGATALAGVTIAAFNTAGAQISSTVTGPYGTYLLPGLVGDHVFLRTFNTGEYRNQRFDGLTCDGYCNVLEGTAIDAIPETLIPGKDFHLQTGFSIAGMVTDTAEAGIGGVLVEVFDTENLQIGFAVSVAGGAFEIDGLPVGDYRLRTTNEAGFIDQVWDDNDCSPEPCDIRDGTIIPITNADVTDVSIQLATGDTIMGTVTDINGNELPTGTAWLYGATAEFLKSAAINNGLFSFTGIADGTYFLKVSNNFGLVDQLYKDKPCPQGACNILADGTPIHVPLEEPAALLSAVSSDSPQATDPPRRNFLNVVLDDGFHISGSIRAMGEPVTFTKVYIFDADGNIAGEGTTDGLGNFESDSGFPNGYYYAATSREGRPEDTPEEAIDAENGVGGGLVDQVWSGSACDGVCEPGPGYGTLIEVQSADISNIHFVLDRAAGVELQKLTNGIDAPTPNGGQAPVIAAGETVNWTYRVTNTGGIELENVSVTDDKGIVISCPKDILAPDESMDCNGSAPAEDLTGEPFTGVSGNCAGIPSSRLYQNTGTVTAATAGGKQVEAEDMSHYCNPRKDLIFESSFE